MIAANTLARANFPPGMEARRLGVHSPRENAMPGEQQHIWPELPFRAWRDTAITLQLWTQIIGKIRLAQTPWVNHSWHVTFYVTAFFDVRDGAITYWREYWDTSHVAQQLGIDPALMFAPLSS